MKRFDLEDTIVYIFAIVSLILLTVDIRASMFFALFSIIGSLWMIGKNRAKINLLEKQLKAIKQTDGQQ